MTSFSRFIFLFSFFFYNCNLNAGSQLSIQTSELELNKLFTDSEYYNYQLPNAESCLAKDEIIEKQIFFELNLHKDKEQFSFKNTSREERTNLNNKYILELKDLAKLWGCHFKKLHLENDSIKSNPSMEKIRNFIQSVAMKGGNIFQIEGQQLFYKLFKKKYRYEIEIKPDNKVILRVKVYFDGSKVTLKEYDYLKSGVTKAVEIWNNTLPTGYKLELIEVEDAKDAHYSIRVTAKSKTTIYDKFWSVVSLTPIDYAHEITHMLGLNEEYNVSRANIYDIFHSKQGQEKNLASKLEEDTSKNSFFSIVEELRANRCFLYSLNCTARLVFLPGNGTLLHPSLYPYQLHHILRRLPVNP